MTNVEAIFKPANLAILAKADNKENIIYKAINNAIVKANSADPLYSYDFTEACQAEWLAKHLGGSLLRYSPGRGRLVFDGSTGIWTTKFADVAWALAVKNAAALRGDLTKAENIQKASRFFVAISSSRGIRAVIDILQSDPRIFTPDDSFDQADWLLNCAGEVFDLRTGEHYPAKPEHCFTMTTGVKLKQGPCPGFSNFMDQITCGRVDLQYWIIRWLAYNLTGDISTPFFANFWGTGRNGKSTLIYLIKKLYGSYAVTVATSVVVTNDRTSPGPRPDLLALNGPRAGFVEEAPAGTLNAEAVKSLTGGDEIIAAAKFRDPISFQPRIKLTIISNNRLHIKNVDVAMQRRFKMVPFDFTIEAGKEDPMLKEKLWDEAPEILWLLIQEAVAYYQAGRGPKAFPACTTIENESSEYLASEDTIGQWLEERTIRYGKGRAASLYNDYKEWAEKTGINPSSSRTFAERLLAKGYRKNRDSQGYYYDMLTLKNAG